MPLSQTTATAGRGGVLSDKHRMPAHGVCLPSLAGNAGARRRSDKIRRMLFDDWRAFLQAILTLFHAQTKAGEILNGINARRVDRETALINRTP